jgi:hypothetical protein
MHGALHAHQGLSTMRHCSVDRDERDGGEIKAPDIDVDHRTDTHCDETFPWQEPSLALIGIDGLDGR